MRTGFRQVQFINCDFRGALFRGCIFDGVSFVNCLLDGMMLSECEIRGKASEPPDTYSDGAAQFRIADSSRIVRQFSRYRPDALGDQLVSDLPGFAAIPKSEDASVELLHFEPGSLIIRGGRTASLSVRRREVCWRFKLVSEGLSGIGIRCDRARFRCEV